METGRERIDRFAHALAAPSRRGLVRWLAAAGLATGFGGMATGAGPAAGAKTEKAKKPNTCKPRCKDCQVCKRGTCKPARDGTRCGEGRTCEDGACARPPVPRVCGEGGSCRVFVTGLTASGSSLGGLNGADQMCGDVAAAAGLSGTYRAWLAAGAESPLTRFTNRGAAGPYRLVRNAADRRNPPPIVADSFADLTACEAGSGLCLRHPIDRTEAGVVVDESAATWTGALPDGTAGDDTCGGRTTGGSGMSGQPTATAAWTQRDPFVTCNNVLTLYCFEQARGPGPGPRSRCGRPRRRRAG